MGSNTAKQIEKDNLKQPVKQILEENKIQIQLEHKVKENYGNSLKVKHTIILPEVKPPTKRQKTQFKLKKVRQSKQNHLQQDEEVQEIHTNAQQDRNYMVQQSKTAPLIPLSQMQHYSSQLRAKRYRVSRML